MSPTPTSHRHASPRLLKLVVVLVVLIGVLGLVSANRQSIHDWIKLRGYQAPASVAQLATDDTMTPYARRVFYVNAPQIDDKTTFAPECPSGTEQTVVLGCYKSDQAGITLLQVTDPRLQGVEQVTAAHETLHALYDRLSGAKRKQVDAWLTDYVSHQLHDQTILDQINSYKKSEPGQVVNEMHSIVGTEVADLPPVLESYYKQYFTDRAAIVHYYDAYQAEFTSRQDEVKQDDAELSALKSQIDGLEQDLQDEAGSLGSQHDQLDNLRRSGQIAAYNAGVPSYNAAVNGYNAQVAQLKDLIDRYNQLVSSRNAVALETQQLTSEITSQVQPIK